MRVQKPFSIAVLLFIVMLFFSSAQGFAQSDDKSSPSLATVSEPLAAEEAAAATDEVEVNRLANPRDTVRLFMEIMNEVKNGNVANIDVGVSCLYLDEIPEADRNTRGPELADQLFKILNAFTFRIDTIPTEPKGKTYSLPVGKELGIEIALYRYDNDEWKFNYTRTLKKLSDYLEAIEKSQKTQSEDSSIDPELSSPREVMNIFLNAMKLPRNAGIADAMRTLDLSRFERAVRREIGEERVAMLKDVMDRYKYVDLVEMPNDRQGPPFVFLTHNTGRIVIERIKNPDSNIESWKFSAQSVEDLPRLYDAFKDRPLVEGVVQSTDIPLSVRVRDYMRKNFPALMKRSLMLENWQWLGMFCIIFAGLGFGKIIVHIFRNIIKVVFKREAVSIDIATEDRFLKPINVTLTTLFWWMGLSLLGLPGEFRLILVVSVKLITAAAAVWAGYRLMDVVGNFLQGKAAKTDNKFDDLLVPLITRALKTIVIVVGLLFIADIFAIDIDKILAGLGLGGLAFALAAKDTISNIFGSLTILIDRPFQIGDWVTIGAADGTVESVGIRSTRIRTFYNSLITIPNSELINAKIDNWGARMYRRITATIGIAYDTPPEKIDSFCEAVRELIRKHPYTRKDFFIVNLTEFSASSLGIMLYCFVKTPDWTTEVREKHRLFADIIRAANRLGVEFAFPTQTLYLRNQEIPEHKNIPANEMAAIQEGREVAGKIVYDTLGEPPVKPPPVTFS